MFKQYWFLTFFVIFVVSFSLSGCLPQSSITTPSSNSSAETEKSGTTTLTGKLQATGKTAVLTSGTTTTALESYSVDFTAFNGQTVTVEGKYSGDTLFVTSVSPVQ